MKHSPKVLNASPSEGHLHLSLPLPLPGSRRTERAALASTVLTYTAGLVAGPLVVLLTRDRALSHQLEGRLALECQRVPVEEAVASPLPVGGNPRVPTASLFNF